VVLPRPCGGACRSPGGHSRPSRERSLREVRVPTTGEPDQPSTRAIADKLTPAQLAQGSADTAHGFATTFTFTVALVLVAVTLVRALLLPRRKVEAPEAEVAAAKGATPVAMH
jgi:hypothetical protein